MNFVFQNAFYCHVCHRSLCVISCFAYLDGKKVCFVHDSYGYDVHLVNVYVPWSQRLSFNIIFFVFAKRRALRANKKIKEAVRVAKFANKE